MTKAETNATRRGADAPAQQFVVWRNDFNFQRRVLEAKDVKGLGAETGKRLAWEQTNNWRIPREDVPLSDDQLQTLIDGDDRFSLSEG